MSRARGNLEQRILEEVCRRPGVTAHDIAETTGRSVVSVHQGVHALRELGRLAPTGVLVPIAGAEIVSRLGRRDRDLYAWACDVVGTTADYSDALGVSINVSRAGAKRLRSAGALAPAYGIWTIEQVEAAQDAAWALLDDILRRAS